MITFECLFKYSYFMEPSCCYTLIPEKEIRQMKKSIPSLHFERRSQLYKVLGDVTKLKILYVLSQYKELNVCDIAKIIEATVSLVSHQLVKLKYMGYIVGHKSGRMVLYSLKDRKILPYVSSTI